MATEKKQAELQETVVSETKEKKQTKTAKKASTTKKTSASKAETKAESEKAAKTTTEKAVGCRKNLRRKGRRKGICRNDEEGICQRSKSDRR